MNDQMESTKNIVILLVAIPPTSAEAPDPADCFRFRGFKTMKSTRRVLAIRSSTCPHRSLICLLCTARFTHVICCTHSLTRSLTGSQAHGKKIFVFERNASISYWFKPLCSCMQWCSRGCSRGCWLSIQDLGFKMWKKLFSNPLRISIAYRECPSVGLPVSPLVRSSVRCAYSTSLTECGL